jgi:endo-1,4-beta-xylanase
MRQFLTASRVPLFAATLLAAGCAPTVTDPGRAVDAQPALHEVFAGSFLIGAALSENQIAGVDAMARALAERHFNSATPENVMKWERIHPQPGRYDFGPADRFVEFGERHGMFLVGHTLVWHSQVPEWVFQDGSGNPATREVLLERMRDHIHTVVGRYRGRVHAWDVVNEALNEDGTLRQSPWLQIIGEDYLAHAFRFAHEADPEAELYYNDYSLENAPKRNGAVALVRRLQEQGVPIHGIGSQLHAWPDWPSLEQLDSTIVAFAGLGIPIMITELDINVLPPAFQYQGADVGMQAELRDALDPYRDGFPEERQQQLAERYAELFRVFLNHREVIPRVTFWGVHDGQSWLNNWPVRGRTNYPLLFDRQGQPKPAFHAVVQVGRQAAAN